MHFYGRSNSPDSPNYTRDPILMCIDQIFNNCKLQKVNEPYIKQLIISYIPLCNYKILLQDFLDYLNKKTEQKYYLKGLFYDPRSKSNIVPFDKGPRIYAPIVNSSNYTIIHRNVKIYWRRIDENKITNVKIYIYKIENGYTLDISFEIPKKIRCYNGVWLSKATYYYLPGRVRYQLPIYPY